MLRKQALEIARWPGRLLVAAMIFGQAQEVSFAQAGSTASSIGAAAPVGQSTIRRAPRLSLERSNVNLGLIGIQFGAGLTLEYNDNVDLAGSGLPGEFGPESDLFVTPSFTIDALIPITQINVISIGITAGYEASLFGTRENTANVAIAPDSEISFRVSAGDVTLQVYDRFGIENHPVGETGLGNARGLSLFTNTAGLQAQWDINDLDVFAGYDYIINREIGSSESFAVDRDSHSFNLAASLSFLGIWTAGLQGSVLLSELSGEQSGKQTSSSIGPFVSVQLTPHTQISASFGLQQFETEGNFTNFGRNSDLAIFGGPIPEDQGSREDTGGDDLLFYWRLSVQNKLNVWYRHGLSAGQERELGLGVESADITYIRYSADWLLFPKMGLQLSTGFDFVEQRFGGLSENATVFRAGLGVAFRVTSHLQAEARYDFASRSSEVEFRDYRQNIVTLSFLYDF